jgi:hypothetical protein
MASSVWIAQLGGTGTGVALGRLVGAAVGAGLDVGAAVGSGVLGCAGTLPSGVGLGFVLGTAHVEPPTNGVDAGVGLAVATARGDEMAADGEQAVNAMMSSRIRKRLGWRMRPLGIGLDRARRARPAL